jgi:2'-5' RNA ligase
MGFVFKGFGGWLRKTYKILNSILIMDFNYYSLVIYPKIKKGEINLFRKKYDSFINIIDFHITLIFPVRVPVDIKERVLIEHIQKITDSWEKFEIMIKGLELSWDNWLFLLVKKGNSKIIKLHDELYSEKMSPFWRKDIRFVPHIAIGSFTKEKEGYDLRNPEKLGLDKEKYNLALKQAKKIDIGYSCKVEKLSLVKLNSELKDCKLVKEFLLN